MNQILYRCNYENINTLNNKNKKIFTIILFISISIIFICIVLYFILKYNYIKKENISKNLVSNFNIQTLYSNSNNYTSKVSSNSDNSVEPFIIGIIEISKINIIYPILSTTSEDLLKISPCRFSRTYAKRSWQFMYCWS